MSNNCFSNWKDLCFREAIIDAYCTAKPLAELNNAVNSLYATLRSGPKLRGSGAVYKLRAATPFVTSFLTNEQVMYYLVTEKIK